MGDQAVASGGTDYAAMLQAAAKGPLKKITYQVLDWVNKQLGKEDPPPGNPTKQETNQKQFLDYLKDGAVLAQLSNVLKPNSVPQVHEKPENKDNMLENIKGFLNFAEKDAGVESAKKVVAEDVQSANPSMFQPLLQTLAGVGGNAAEKFNLDTVKNLDFDQLNAMATLTTGKSFMQHLMALKDRLFKRQPAVTADAAATKQEVNNDQSAPPPSAGAVAEPEAVKASV